MKLCTSCGCEKPIAEFGRNKAKKDGLQNYCLPCNRVASRISKSATRAAPTSPGYVHDVEFHRMVSRVWRPTAGVAA